MLEFIRRELKFKLDDVEYNLKFPSVKQISLYSKEYDESDDKFICVINFLANLGLKSEISEGMEMNHLTQIVEALTQEKK